MAEISFDMYYKSSPCACARAPALSNIGVACNQVPSQKLPDIVDRSPAIRNLIYGKRTAPPLRPWGSRSVNNLRLLESDEIKSAVPGPRVARTNELVYDSLAPKVLVGAAQVDRSPSTPKSTICAQ